MWTKRSLYICPLPSLSFYVNCIIYTHSQHICWVIVPFLCKRLNQTFHMSTLDIFPMQKRCQMNNLWSLFAMKYSFLSLPAFPNGRILYRRALWRNLCSRKQTSVYLYPQYVSILGMKKFHLDENSQICWIKQIDGIEVEQSNLNFQTSLIIWVALPRFIIK